jgi:large subunit ribosomal protein L9
MEAKAMEERKKKDAARELQESQQLATKLDGKEIEVKGKVSTEGKLYAAIGQKAIADAIKKQLKVDVPSDRVAIAKPLKEVGESSVAIRFGHGLEADIRVIISAS